MKVAAANVTGRDEGCEGGDGGSEGRGGLGEVKAGAELAAGAELVMVTPRLVESWAVSPPRSDTANWEEASDDTTMVT